MAFLTRIDPTRNIDRFYVVEVIPSLFGEWTVMREWGRRGAPGTVRLSSYQQRDEAEAVERHDQAPAAARLSGSDACLIQSRCRPLHFYLGAVADSPDFIELDRQTATDD
jgi:predicted DNA-binding WGR domain protein